MYIYIWRHAPGPYETKQGLEHNVKELFYDLKGLKKKVGMNGALEILQIPLEGTHHRGVDDAKNIAKILHWCLKNQ